MYQGWLMLRVQKLFEDNPVSGRRYLSGIPSRCLPNTMVRFCSEIEFSLPCYSVNDVQTVSLAFESDELDFGFANLFLLFHYQTNTTNRITPGLSSCWFLIYIDFLYFYIIYDNDVLKYLTRSGGPCLVACLGLYPIGSSQTSASRLKRSSLYCQWPTVARTRSTFPRNLEMADALIARQRELRRLAGWYCCSSCCWRRTDLAEQNSKLQLLKQDTTSHQLEGTGSGMQSHKLN